MDEKFDVMIKKIGEIYAQLYDGAITAEEFYNSSCARVAEFSLFAQSLEADPKK